MVGLYQRAQGKLARTMTKMFFRLSLVDIKSPAYSYDGKKL